MMNIIAKWGVKTWVLSAVNKMLENYSTNIQAALATVDTWITKAEAVLNYLKGLRTKIEDSKITDEESDAIVTETTALVKAVIA